MKRSWALSVGVLSFLCVVAFFSYDFLWVHKVIPAVVTSGSIVQTIVASGHVESPHRISISAQVAGTVTDIPVLEGQAVKQGQLLIALEDAEAQAALKQAEASLAQEISNLRQVREVKSPVAEQAHDQSQANLESAERHLLRSLALYDKGFIGEAAKDDAQLAFRIAQSQFSISQQQSQSLRPEGSEMGVALAKVIQAQAALALARTRTLHYRIRSPRAGILISRNVEVGDGVQPGKTLMTLSPEGVIELVLQIDEKNIQWLKLNQPAQVIADAYPDQKFLARLVYINPAIDPQRGSVTVKLQALNAPVALKQDMTVTVDIEVLRADQASLLPTSVVHDEDSPRPWVLRIQDGVAHKQFISLGLRSQGHAQVLSGLNPGDRVVPSKAGHVRDGAFVQTIEP